MRRDVAYTASRRVGCYVGTYQMPHRDVISTVSSKTLRKSYGIHHALNRILQKKAMEIAKYRTENKYFCSMLPVFLPLKRLNIAFLWQLYGR